MTSPSLPSFINTSRRSYRYKLRSQRRRTLRKQTLEYLLLFTFFTFFFAIATIAAFS